MKAPNPESSPEDDTTPIHPSSLSHLVLRTSPTNFSRMCSFYKSFLDATPSFKNPSICFLGYDEEHHRIGIITDPSIAPPASSPPSSTVTTAQEASGETRNVAKREERLMRAPGLAHVAFTFPSHIILARFLLSRQKRGIRPSVCLDHGPTTSMYWHDPDGNEVETMAWNIESREEIDRFLESERFRANPVGEIFDGEIWAREVLRGG